MTHSDSIKNIATALIAFQTAVSSVKKTETNPFFKSKYADLTAVLNAIKEPLEKAGLAFVQFPDGDGLTTMLMHALSGEWMQATLPLKLVKQDAQGQGAAITYLRRYSLGSILGLITEEDDDGNKASQTSNQGHPSAPSAVWQNTPRPANLVSSSACPKCGAPMSSTPSKKSGKPWCTAKCWLNPQPPVVQYGDDEQLPPL